MKHTKPFKCEVLGCKRTQGFSSVNDRNRHMNSVHKMHVSGNAVGYDCQYDNCRDNGKIFFRLDNFRNHLKKKHGPTKATGGELEDFLKRCVFSVFSVFFSFVFVLFLHFFFLHFLLSLHSLFLPSFRRSGSNIYWGAVSSLISFFNKERNRNAEGYNPWSI